MKSLSNIILEESIRAALTELETKKSKETKKDDKSISTPKKDKWGRSIGDKWYGFNPKTKKWEFDKNDQSLHRQQAFMIANKIYKSKGTWNDDEDGVVAAFTSIPNLATFYQVNNILKTNTGKSTSGYIRSFINSKEVNVWIPLIKHLIKLNAPDIVVATYTNKADWDKLKSNDSALAKKLQKKKSGLTDVEIGDFYGVYSWMWVAVLYLIANRLGVKPGKWLWGMISKNYKSKQIINQPSMASIWQLQTHMGAPKFWNKTRLKQLLRYEYSQGRISNEEYEQLLRALKNVDSKALNRKYFDLIVKALKRRIPGDVKPGKVRELLVALDDKEFAKVWGPKLQAIEDDILGTKKAEPKTTDTSLNPVKNYTKQLKELGFSVKKPNFQNWNMNRWIMLQNKIGNNISTDEQRHLNEISKIFKTNLKSQNNPAKAAFDAADFYWSKLVDKDYSQLYINNQRIISDQWIDWISKTKNGNKSYKLYDEFSNFPAFNQWQVDMKQIGIKNYTKLDYDIAHYNWLNTRTP